MNAPLRFESLLWMASPMEAWAQASAEPPPAPTPIPGKRARATRANATAKSPRKPGKHAA